MDKNDSQNEIDSTKIPEQPPPTTYVDSDGEPSSSKDTTRNSHETTTKYLGAKRKRYSSRIIKRTNIRDGRKVIKKGNSTTIRKKKKLDANKLLISTITTTLNSGKQARGDHDNESSSNSENSENANLFNEINWEENLEIDASDELVEEFAPRPTAGMISQKIKMEPLQFLEEQPEGAGNIEDEIEEKFKVTLKEQEPPEKPVLIKIEEGELDKDEDVYEPKIDNNSASLSHPTSNDISIEQEFTPGLQILVKDYKTTEWNKASILEVDWDEEEVLVHYDARKPDEWVSMSSQRLSRTTKRSRTAISIPKVAEKVEVKSEDNVDVKKGLLSTQEVKILNSEEHPSNQQQQPTVTALETAGMRNRKNRTSPKFRRYRSSRKNWRFKRQSSLDTSEKYKGKFKVGEKVLAKWSKHRMQKFPAVIKSICGKGAYDLLFYDGFEKTISEEHIYKTTEEEAAKYQDSKPSEADSFVDMDDDSKEARRQRKKKTFDDYVFAKDLKKRSRKVLPLEEGSTSTAGGGNAPVPSTSAVTTKKALLQTLHTHCRKGKKRKKLLSDEKEDEEDGDIQSPTVNDSANNDYENSTVGGGADSDNYHEMLGESEDRWTGEIPPDSKPLNIECTDGIRKSVIVPDKVLPIGWTKQCINRTGQMWETFLISPEGYRLNTTKDLKEYSRQILGSRTPRNLDFLVNTKILPELIGKQENLQPLNNWLPWLGKSGKRKKMKMNSTGLMSPFNVQQQGNSQQNRVGRIRTLLPKCRTPQVLPTNATAINEPPIAIFSEIWRCPKQGCDKKFRKENLLQMHIKHYHAEFSALVGNAPNVVDLACARSESVNADRTKSPLPFPAKKLNTKTPSQTPPHNSETIKSEVDDTSPASNVTTTQIIAVPKVVKTESQESIAISNTQPLLQVEERKSTIKTMLPLRQSTTSTLQESMTSPRLLGSHVDSEEFDSDDGGHCVETKQFGKHGRVQQLPTQRGKKIEKKLSSAIRTADDITFPLSPSFKHTRKKLPVLDKLQITTDSNDSFTEEEKVSPNTEATTDEGGPSSGGVIIERLKSEEIINCTCEYREEDGLMIQCDICMCWQHGLCSGVETEADVPERYVCYICRHPAKVRSSKKYSYALHYLSQGKLPTFSFRSKNENDIQQKEMLLKRCYELSANLRQIQNVERSLRAKINIAEQPGHPKLYLWANNWDESNNVSVKIKEENNKDRISSVENGSTTTDSGNVTSDLMDGVENKIKEDKLSGVPEPEAPIDLEECRMKLLDHIDSYYQQLDDRLMSLQTQIAALESQDADLSSNVVPDRLMKQTIQMLLRDLKTVQKIAAVSS